MKHKNPEFAVEFNRRLCARMEYFGMNVTDLAKAAGLPISTTWILVKSIDRVPHADTVVKLARALAMTTDELINF